MNIKFCIIPLGLFPIAISAQVKHPISQLQTQSAQMEAPLDSICDNVIFTRTEVPPVPKVEKTTFEDSLTSFLKSKNDFPQTGFINLICIVTRDGKLREVKVESANIKNDDVSKYMLAHPDIWSSAKQHGNNVCAFAHLYIKFDNGKLEANFPIRK